MLVRTSVGLAPTAPAPPQPPPAVPENVSEEAVAGLMTMFPDRSREEIVSAWTASRGNLASAVNLILHPTAAATPPRPQTR